MENVKSENYHSENSIAKMPSIQIVRKNSLLLENSGVLKDLFSGTIADWKGISPNGKITYSKEKTFFSSKSAKLEIINDFSFDAKFHKNIDLTVTDSDTIEISFYVEDIHTCGGLEFIFYAPTDITQYTNNYSYKLQQHELVIGWNHVKLTKNDFTANGSPVWSNFKSMRIRLYPFKSKGSIVYLDAIHINRRIKPTVILNFDDSQLSLFTNAFPIMKANNMRGTLFVSNRSYNPNYEGQVVPSVMNNEQHLELYKNGWDIGNHSKTHNNVIDLSTNTNYLEQYHELEYTTNYMIDIGCTKSMTTFAAPNGKYNTTTIKVLEDLNFRMVRSSGGGYISGEFGEGITCMHTQEIQNDVTIEKIKGWIDKAIELGSAVSIFTHAILPNNTDKYSVDLEIFKQMIAYIKQKVDTNLIQVLTFDEFYKNSVGTKTYNYAEKEISSKDNEIKDIIPIENNVFKVGSNTNKFKEINATTVKTNSIDADVIEIKVNGITKVKFQSNQIQMYAPFVANSDNQFDIGVMWNRFRNICLSGYITTGKGTTGSRPTGLDNSMAGTMWYDITLKKPIWWSGEAWTDATGTIV